MEAFRQGLDSTFGFHLQLQLQLEFAVGVGVGGMGTSNKGIAWNRTEINVRQRQVKTD